MVYGVSYYGSHFTDHIVRDMEALEGTVDYIVYAVSEFTMRFSEGAMRTVLAEAHITRDPRLPRSLGLRRRPRR
jgi:hypothetical protein